MLPEVRFGGTGGCGRQRGAASQGKGNAASLCLQPHTHSPPQNPICLQQSINLFAGAVARGVSLGWGQPPKEVWDPPAWGQAWALLRSCSPPEALGSTGCCHRHVPLPSDTERGQARLQLHKRDTRTLFTSRYKIIFL